MSTFRQFGQNLAIVIGVNQYHHGIAPLQTAVPDAQALAQILQDDHHFSVSQRLDDAVTLKQLQHLFHNELPTQVAEGDRLLIYFAGHGIAKASDAGPAGYLIPQDAHPEDEGTFLSMQEIYTALAQLPCRHFLLILDCCFAGAFRWASSRDLLVPEKMYRQRFERFAKCAAWQVLTSAAYDQKALDILHDTRGGGTAETSHSPFALALFEALAGQADLIRDQVITATELYLYLRHHVESRSGERQTPGLWPLPKHDGGEFFFLTQDFDAARLEEAPTLSPENNPYRGLATYDERHAPLFFGRDPWVKALYHDHVASQPLTVVVGASGTGKSSLVKAGLIPYLRRADFLERRNSFQDLAQQVPDPWHILPVLRSGHDPLAALAQICLPMVPEPPSQAVLSALADFHAVVATRPTDLPSAFIKTWPGLTNQPKAQLILVMEGARALEDHWRCQPENAPEQALETLQRLVEKAEAWVRRLTQHLQQDDTLFQTLLAQWLGAAPQAKVLLVIDQAEELITQTRQDEPRQRFIRYLEAALAAYPEQLRCVLTVRLDFEPLVKQAFSPQWQEQWERQGRMVVPPMTQDDLRQAIEGPANEVVLHFEPASLVDELINEVVQMPGALPLLSFTLSELYIQCFERFRQGDLNRALTQTDYEHLGRVSGSLRYRANQEFDRLNAAEQQTLRNIMLRMVAMEGGELARRRVLKQELVYSTPEENQRVTTILNRLIEQRLVTSGRTVEGDYVEPAHDALVRGWEKIARWLNEEVEVQPEPTLGQRILGVFGRGKRQPGSKNSPTERQLAFNLPLQRQVTAAAAQWRPFQNSKQQYDYLWTRDPRLLQLKQVKEQRSGEGNWLNQVEVEFVDRSARRKETLFRRWIVGTTVVFALISSVAVIAIAQRNRAVANEQEAQQQLVRTLNQSASTHLASGDSFDALIEATKAGNLILRNRYLQNETELVAQTQSRLYESGVEVNQIFHIQNTAALSFSPNGQHLAFGGNEGDIKLWHRNSNQIKSLDEQHESRIWTTAFSPNSQYFASGRSDGSVHLWQVEDGIPIEMLDRLHQEGVLNIEFSPNSQYLKSKDSAGIVRLWDIDGNSTDFFDDEHEEELFALEFSPNSQYIASRVENNKVWLRGIDGTLIELRDSQHGWRVSDFIFSPNSQYFAASGEDGIVRLWQLDGTSIELPGSQHDGRVSGIEFSPNSQYFASGGEDGIVRIWQIDDTPIEIFNSQHNGRVTGIEFSPNNQYFASAGEDGAAQIWRIDDMLVSSLTSQVAPQLLTIEFSPDSQYIGSRREDGVINLWHVDGTPINLLDNQRGWGIADITFSPDSQFLASGGRDGNAQLWRINGIPVNLSSRQMGRHVLSVEFSPDSQYFAVRRSGDVIRRGDTVELWHVNDTPIESFKFNDQKEVWEIKFSSDGRYLAAGSRTGAINLWKINDSQTEILDDVQDNFQDTRMVWDIKFSPDNQFFAASKESGIVQLWNVDGSLVRSQESQNKLGFSKIKFSLDSQYIAVIKNEFYVQLWHVDGTLIELLSDQKESRILEVEFSLDSQYITVARDDGVVQLWNVDGSLIDSFETISEGTALSIAFSPNRQYFATGKDDGDVQIWHVDGTEIELTNNQHDWKGAVLEVVFSPDGQYLMARSVGLVQLWRVDGTQVELPDSYHGWGVWSIMFSLDSQYIASSRRSGDVQLWRIDGTPIKLPNSQHGSETIWSIAFSPDSQYFASNGGDGTVRLWQVDGTPIGSLMMADEDGGIRAIEFDPSSQYLTVGSEDGVVWMLPLKLEDIVEKSCDWLWFYINASSEEERESLRFCVDYLDAQTAQQQSSNLFSTAISDLTLLPEALSAFNQHASTLDLN